MKKKALQPPEVHIGRALGSEGFLALVGRKAGPLKDRRRVSRAQTKVQLRKEEE